MGEYIIDGTLLTNIASAIRTVNGSSALLTPAQMVTTLTGIKSSVDAALSALTDKDIEVPSGSTVHGLASLITTIEAGGGLPAGIAAMTAGTYTPTTAVTGCTITHGLGVVPDFFFIYCVDSHHYSHCCMTDCIRLGRKAYALMVAAGSSVCNLGGYSLNIDESAYPMTSSEVTFGYGFTAPSKTYLAYFEKAYSYRWFAGVYA